jgi:hypothetical protein
VSEETLAAALAAAGVAYSVLERATPSLEDLFVMFIRGQGKA